MKAILIIDVDENADFENAIADITFRDNEWGTAPIGIKHWYNGIKLKPLPHNDFIDEAEGYETEEEYKAYVSGWNDCLDEILGGNDE